MIDVGKKYNQSGQSLFEVMIAVGISAVIIGAVAASLVVSVRSGAGSNESQAAYGLAKEVADNVRSYAEANWANVYNRTKGSNTQYYLAPTATSSASTTLGLSTGTTNMTNAGVAYTTWFSIENAERNQNNGAVVTSGGTSDPATQKVTVHVSWDAGSGTREIQLVTYIGRVKSSTSLQNNWGGSSGTTDAVNSGTRNYFYTDELTTNATSVSIRLPQYPTPPPGP